MVAVLDDPTTIYRRVEFDARIEGSDGAALTRLCLERAIGEIARARSASDRATRADALAGAGAALLALMEGVALDNPLRRPLLEFYGGVRAGVLATLIRPDDATLAQAQRDLSDVKGVLDQTDRA